MDAPSWRPLPLQASSGAPALLVSTRFMRDAYAVHVTDLAHVWSESLDRKSIYRRSLDLDTSIDPTDNSSNMQQFLSRVRSALDPAHENHLESRATLEATKDDGLTIKITCDIPGLQPLKWDIHLKKELSSRIATELVLPLLRANFERQRQIDALLEIIRQKDVVMNKLVDKLQSTGTPLEHVFTILSAKHKVTRKMAEDKINGLAPLNATRWKDEMAAEEEGPKDTAALANAVFGQGMAYSVGEDAAGLEDWWTQLKDGVKIDRPEKETKTNAAPQKDPVADEEEDDDEFQVQSSPPKPQRSSPQKPSAEPEEPPPRAKPKQTRLGAIGKKKRASPTPPPAPPAPAGSDTESASDDEVAEKPSPVKPRANVPSPTPTAPPPKKGLGRIGGAKAKPQTQTEAEIEDEASAGPETAPKKSELPRRLGQIGKKPAAKTPQASENPDHTAEKETRPTRGRTATQDKDAAAPAPRDTSEERANRVRDELARDLEQRRAAGPARKKRRF